MILLILILGILDILMRLLMWLLMIVCMHGFMKLYGKLVIGLGTAADIDLDQVRWPQGPLARLLDLRHRWQDTTGRVRWHGVGRGVGADPLESLSCPRCNKKRYEHWPHAHSTLDAVRRPPLKMSTGRRPNAK